MLLVLSSGLSVVAEDGRNAALPVALIAAYVVAGERVPLMRRHPVVSGTLEAVFAGAAVAWTGGAASPLLPYLLAPPLAVGLAGGARETGLVTAGSALGLAAGALSAPPDDLGSYLGASLQWLLLGLAFGLVAGWSQLLAGEDDTSSDRYAEARSLLEQLRQITHRLPGGLDVAASAEALLQACADLVPATRSAVLVQPSSSGALVPVAVRGTKRVPWRAPLTAPGPLQTAWETGQPVVDQRTADAPGRRHGSTLLVLPIRSGNETIGLVGLDSLAPDPFPSNLVQSLVDCIEVGALRLETAMLFEVVRSSVTIEERDRLAREMHDGVAQELASVGYQLDALHGQAALVDPTLAENIVEVRTGLTRLISDIRLSITDLRTSVTSDRGLGAALANYVRAVGSGQGITVHVTLEESAFRLPGEQEVVLFQIAQAVAQDVRRATQASNLWVTLFVEPPSARLVVEHDGHGGAADLDLADLTRQLARFGGSLAVHDRDVSGVHVTAVLEGGDHGSTGDAGR